MRTNSKVKSEPLYTHEGGVAKKITPLQMLQRSVLSCMLFEGEYYEDGETISKRIAELVDKVKPEQVAELALKARGEGNLRHVPLFLTKLLVNKHYTGVAKLIEQVIQRPDELGELIALYKKDGAKSLSAQLKKGLAKAFNKFSAYQIQKYQGHEREYTLRDVMFLVRPNPFDNTSKDAKEMPNIYKKLANKELLAPDTWEVALSTGKDKKETFTRLIDEKALGALAMLRNLRNMQQAGVTPATIRKGLSNMKIERVLPFRFITAARYAADYEPELEAAMFKCLDSEAKLPGLTVLLVDVSGSMDAPIGGKSELSRRDAAYALGMLAREICEDVRIYTFSNDAKKVPNRRGFALRDAMNTNQSHGGTDLGGAVSSIKENYDRLIVFTDEQSRTVVPAPRNRGYMVNVASARNGVGYGAWTHIDGFSSAVIDYIVDYENLDVD